MVNSALSLIAGVLGEWIPGIFIFHDPKFTPSAQAFKGLIKSNCTTTGEFPLIDRQEDREDGAAAPWFSAASQTEDAMTFFYRVLHKGES